MINLYKRLGETPLQASERYRASHPELKDIAMTYAGRLDPMAEGVLVILTGEENKDRARFIALGKEYEFEFIFGLRTDTYDVLGILESEGNVFKEPVKELVERALQKYKGSFEQSYPPFSSKMVNGEPLFELARQGKLRGKTLPRHMVTVGESILLSSEIIYKEELIQKIISNISLVKGDFRQSEIVKRWDKYFAGTLRETFTVWKARLSCDSGFYVRELVHNIGEDLVQGAVTFSILRRRVGDYSIEQSVR